MTRCLFCSWITHFHPLNVFREQGVGIALQQSAWLGNWSAHIHCLFTYTRISGNRFSLLKMELLPSCCRSQSRLIVFTKAIYCMCGAWSSGTALGETLGFTKGAGLTLVTGGETKRNVGCRAKWCGHPSLRVLVPNQQPNKIFEVSSCWQCYLRSVNRHPIQTMVMEGSLVLGKKAVNKLEFVEHRTAKDQLTFCRAAIQPKSCYSF